jgi:hypothetical protein
MLPPAVEDLISGMVPAYVTNPEFVPALALK